MTVTRTNRTAQNRFLAGLRDIIPDPRLIWIPQTGDTLLGVDYSGSGKVITWNDTKAGQLSALGQGFQQSFDGSSDSGSFPLDTSFGFGNTTVDTSFSLIAPLNVTNSAGARAIFCKWQTNNGEYVWQITAGDLIQLLLRDESAGVTVNRVSDAVITQGAWHTFAATYDGGGGATAANGIVLYQDGVLIASTATNNASYVAMEPKTNAGEIGVKFNNTQDWFLGAMAHLIIAKGVLTAAQLLQHKALCNGFYGLSL